MAKKCIADLSKDEKAELVSRTQKGRPGATNSKRANILLLAALTRLESLSYEAVRLVLKKRSQTLAAPEMVNPNSREKKNGGQSSPNRRVQARCGA